MTRDIRHKLARQREPKMKGATKHRLTAAVLAAGAEEAGFMDADSRDGVKRPQRAKYETRDE